MAQALILNGEELEQELILGPGVQQEDIVSNDFINEILPKFGCDL